MPNKKEYIHNSTQKDYIRKKWIEFSRATFDGADHDFSIITFPAEAMQDLHEFQAAGLIGWEQVETKSADGTKNFRITKGKVRCFEKKTSIYAKLRTKLVDADVRNDDFCTYVATGHSKIMGGSDKTFPVDVVNLDFESRLYPNDRYPIDHTIDLIFTYQKKHKWNFSLFLTWPLVEAQDEHSFKALLDSTIESNLADVSAVKFKNRFEKEIGSPKNLAYERKSIIGVSKIILKKSSQKLYKLEKAEFFTYGGGSRQRMISLMFNFKYTGKAGHENIIYATDVEKAMDAVNEIS
jgi:hypothetical protein